MCVRNGCMDRELQKAIIAWMPKNLASLANRPIGLLCTEFYKSIAVLVQAGLDTGLEACLMQTQFGLCKSKSTSEAMFIARHLQLSPQANGNSVLLFSRSGDFIRKQNNTVLA